MGADSTRTTDLVTVNLAIKRVYLYFRGSLTKTQGSVPYRSASWRARCKKALPVVLATMTV